MLKHLILFEWKFYNRKVTFYLMLLCFISLGTVVGTSAKLSFPNIYYNSPFAINFILSLFSLVCLFPILIAAAQSLPREKENHFEQVLYSTQISVGNYLTSRFLTVFGVAILSFFLFLIGYMFGHLMAAEDNDKWGAFHFNYYLNSFLLIVIPNIFLCAALVCCTAWLSRNKMLIYLSGLAIYILYMVGSIFSNSPLLAGASPVSDSAMQLSAKLDPFGVIAFFEQTQSWTAPQKNTELLELSGCLLFNRATYLILALVILYATYKRFHFRISKKPKKNTNLRTLTSTSTRAYSASPTKTDGKAYFAAAFMSFFLLDLKSTIRRIPFMLLIVLTVFILCMEMYGTIQGGIRIPQNFATTNLMVNTILSTLPVILLFTMLFYGSELVWKSKSARFYSIENSTPYQNVVLYASKFATISVLSYILISFSITVGIIFQLYFRCTSIDWQAYFTLFYFIGLPASLCGLFIISMQYIVGNKYIALTLSAVFLVFTNSSLGKMVGLKHPLTRFANFMSGTRSDINGYGFLAESFTISMLYSLSIAALLYSVAITLTRSRRNTKKWRTPSILLFLTLTIGTFVYKKSEFASKDSLLTWKEHYEQKFRMYKDIPQPTIAEVKANIDLYPEKNYYHVRGTYTLVNKTSSTISEILVSTSKELNWKSLISPHLELQEQDDQFGTWMFDANKKMVMGDTITIAFSFEYEINPLDGHESFNAIVENGAFMRISNYFPSIGYEHNYEINDELERERRNMPKQDPLTKVDAPLDSVYDYEFIDLDLTIATSGQQTAVSVGDLMDSYSIKDRRVFLYRARNIPFRFAVSSAEYAIEKSSYNGVAIEVFYHPKHHQNIKNLISSIKTTLKYCESNFSPYPYETIRFAEISSFTQGFAATAYPATIYINEDQFHLNLSQGYGQDVINGLAGHEISHQWWGNAQLKPDYREGSGVLTETLAQYTELMLYKNAYGKDRMLEMVELHKGMYEREKAFSGDEALYLSDPGNANVIYNKGLVVMYELYKLIGEKKINSALRNLLDRHRFPLPPATSLNLIEELKLVSESGFHSQIEDLFKR